MYAETGLMFPYFQNFSQEVQQLEDFWCSPKSNASMDNFVQNSTILEYDLGGEGDLFKAPEPIIQEPMVGLDPMTDVISMISCGEDVISSQALKVADIESIQSEFFYECKKDILAKEATETPLSEVMNIKIPVARTEENPIAEAKLLPQGPFPKSVSSGCLSSMEWVHGAPHGVPMRPNFLDFPVMDFGADGGMRRAFSDGDIKTLGNGNVHLIHSSLGQPQIMSNCTTEDRRQKLSRYRNKKERRNFGRKIKYACRKALADSQPRIRGRFAKTD